MLAVGQRAKVKSAGAKLTHEKYLNDLDSVSWGHGMLGMVVGV